MDVSRKLGQTDKLSPGQPPFPPASLTKAQSLDSGFAGGTVVKNLPATAEDIRGRVWSLGWEDPLSGAWQPTPVFLPEESHGQRSLWGYSPWGCKESDMTEHAHTQVLNKENLGITIWGRSWIRFQKRHRWCLCTRLLRVDWTLSFSLWLHHLLMK